MSDAGIPAGSSNRTWQTRRTLRWIGGALALSLAINLFAGGYMIGRFVNDPDQFRGPHPRFYQMARDLSPEGKAVVKAVVQEHLKPLRKDMAEMRALRDKVQGLLLTEEMDLAELEATLNQMRQHNSAVQDGIHRATLDVARQLPADERGKLRFDHDPKRGKDYKKTGP